MTIKKTPFTEKDTFKEGNKDAFQALNASKANKIVSKTEDNAETAVEQDSNRPATFEARDSKSEGSTEDVQDQTNIDLKTSDNVPTSQIAMIADAVRAQTRKQFEDAETEFQAEIERLRLELDKTNEAIVEKEQLAKDALEKKEAERQQLINIFGFTGGNLPASVVSGNATDAVSQTPNIPYITGGSLSRYHCQDLLREYKRIIEKDCNGVTVHTPSGETVVHKDLRFADRFYQDHRDALLRGLESEMQSKGYLRGGIASRDNTTPGDLPSAFLDIASAEGRQTHHEDTIYWQFARRMTDPSISVEQTGRFPRLEFGSIGESPNDYFLGSSITALNTNTEALRTSSVPIEIRELGIGKPGTTLKPISISEIITSNSIFDALNAINMRLVKSFNRAEDWIIRSLIHSTSRGGYVSDGQLVETAAEVVSGGQITQKFLSHLYGYMSALQIPKLSDGCYFLTMPPQSFSILRADMIERQRFTDASSVEALTNVMREYHGDANLKRNTGYQGKIENFHVFLATSYGTGSPTTPGVEGVATETLGSTAVTVRNCYAFGVDTVGVLESMPFTIRQRSENSFGRFSEFIWLQHAGYGALDIDPLRTRQTFETVGDTSSEQLRVLDIRCADIAV
jgi:hypothetical protein